MRRLLANALARLARRIYPQSQEVMSFYVDRMMELAITGQSAIKIQHIPPAEYRHQQYGYDLSTDKDGNVRVERA